MTYKNTLSLNTSLNPLFSLKSFSYIKKPDKFFFLEINSTDVFSSYLKKQITEICKQRIGNTHTETTKRSTIGILNTLRIIILVKKKFHLNVHNFTKNDLHLTEIIWIERKWVSVYSSRITRITSCSHCEYYSNINILCLGSWPASSVSTAYLYFIYLLLKNSESNYISQSSIINIRLFNYMGN